MKWVRYRVGESEYDTFNMDADKLYWAARGREPHMQKGEWQPGSLPQTPEGLPSGTGGPGEWSAGGEWSREVASAGEWWEILGGRSLLAGEVLSLLEYHLGRPEDVWRRVRILVLTGAAQAVPGVVATGPFLRYRCLRCGGTDTILRTWCARCRGECFYCEQCLIMGRSQACIPLFLFEPRPQREQLPQV